MRRVLLLVLIVSIFTLATSAVAYASSGTDVTASQLDDGAWGF